MRHLPPLLRTPFAVVDTGQDLGFRRSLGSMDGIWRDVRGADCLHCDPRTGDPADYPLGFGSQGDAVRIDNLVRSVRDADE